MSNQNNPLLRIDNLIKYINNALIESEPLKSISSHQTQSNDHVFTVISFNVLATCYARKHPTTYNYCSQEYLNGNYRFKLIGDIFSKKKADIIALQEVDKPSETLELMNLINNQLYKVHYQKRPNDKQDGLVIAYNQNKFKSYNNMKPQCIQLNDLCKGCKSQNTKIYYKKECIAMYIYLYNINNPDHIFIVINTHLYYHPNKADIRLRQLAYILNTINYKTNQLINTQNIDTISIIFCGDFNTLPNTSPYQYMLNGEYELKAKGNSTLKLITDSQLNKIARNCRSLGVDTVCFDQMKLDKINIEKLFNQAYNEDRILITRSKKLAARKVCPPCLLLTSNDFRDNLKEIIKFFGLKYNDNIAYSRCTLCNGLFKQIKNKNDISQHALIPNELKDIKLISFWQCLDCKKMIWFGHNKNNQKNNLTASMINILKIMKEIDNNINDQKDNNQQNQQNESILHLLPNLQQLFWNNVKIVNPFGNQLKSSYIEIYNKSPKYTNKTSSFTGCLDYIFYGNVFGCNDGQNKLKCIDCQLIEGDKKFYPNKSWPSDHIMLLSTFQID